MGFKKGNTLGQGRPKGSPDKKTKELRSFINEFIESNKGKIQADFDALEPIERINSIVKLLEFTTPKLQRTQLEGDITHKNHVVVTIENEQPKIEDNGKSN
jgi:hypothetical protein